MEAIKYILGRLEVIFCSMAALLITPLHSSVPYNMWLFLFDLSLVSFLGIEYFPSELFKGDREEALEKWNMYLLRMWEILSIIILAKYTYVFENLYLFLFG